MLKELFNTRNCNLLFRSSSRKSIQRIFIASTTHDMATSTKTQHPPWTQPTQGIDRGLTVYNSLTSSKVPFIPQQGNRVDWYACGPTVYSSSHMGHARAYVTFDIIRRILEDYFHYDLNLTMNVTDVDDKIILRARRDYLFAEYKKELPGIELGQLLDDIKASFTLALGKAEKAVKDVETELEEAKLDKQKKKQLEKLEEQLDGEQYKLKDIQKQNRCFEALTKIASDANKLGLLNNAVEVLPAYLDKLNGAEVRDQSIYKKHAQKFELEFLEDLKILNVRDVDVMTRVTEYMPQIIQYIEKIIENGYAYVSHNSVYFNIAEFQKTHAYARLKPSQVGNLSALAEGEGALIGASSEKRNTIDFALWKASKAGEPWWDSPWGKGRPGWHIECSTMASDTLGSVMDIHSGGVDLCFPHHDNEMAQAEAYFSGNGYEHQQWVNYFMHAGHLHIDGLKMSKSLKNFITIRQALENNTPEQIRLVFLMQAWEKPIQYSDDHLATAVQTENLMKNFFLSIKSAVHHNGLIGLTDQVWSDTDRKMNDEIIQVQNDVHKALCDNLDYPKAMSVVIALISHTNGYMQGETKNLLLRKSGDFVTKLLRIVGVLKDDPIGFQPQSGVDSFEALAPLLDQLCLYRDAVRNGFRSKKDHDYFVTVSEEMKRRVKRSVPGIVLDEEEKHQPWRVHPHQEISERVTDIFERKLLEAIAAAQLEREQSILNALYGFYTAVVIGAQEKKPMGYFGQASDKIRDETMEALGVRMEDEKERSFWKLDDPSVLRQEREVKNKEKLQKDKEKLQKDLNKAKNQLEEQRKIQEKFISASTARPEYFQQIFKSTFTQFDDNGLPTHDQSGQELSATFLKRKLKPALKKRKKLEVALQKQVQKDPNFLSETLPQKISDVEEKIERLSKELKSSEELKNGDPACSELN